MRVVAALCFSLAALSLAFAVASLGPISATQIAWRFALPVAFVVAGFMLAMRSENRNPDLN